jgi:glycosyltransferase involved in cell wall biosynthesis
MNQASSSHVVLIPCYNPGPKVFDTVRIARQYWNPLWVIIDGSTDGTDQGLLEMQKHDAGLRILALARNSGKGAAILHGLDEASRQGFSHALCMDADGQHSAEQIPQFMALSRQFPDNMVLGVPVFDASAPALRVKGRKISNWWANLETLWTGIGDSLFGYRVYPIEPLRLIMHKQHWMRRFDFDPEAVVRLCWDGVRPVNLPSAVRYFRADEGGVSHFNYWRDNRLLTWMHIRLMIAFLLRLPLLIRKRLSMPKEDSNE